MWLCPCVTWIQVTLSWPCRLLHVKTDWIWICWKQATNCSRPPSESYFLLRIPDLTDRITNNTRTPGPISRVNSCIADFIHAFFGSNFILETFVSSNNESLHNTPGASNSLEWMQVKTFRTNIPSIACQVLAQSQDWAGFKGIKDKKTYRIRKTEIG